MMKIDTSEIERWASRGSRIAKDMMREIENGEFDEGSISNYFGILLTQLDHAMRRESGLQSSLSVAESDLRAEKERHRPIRVISLPGGWSMNPNMEEAGDYINRELKKAREDTTYIPVFPFPIDIQEI